MADPLTGDGRCALCGDPSDRERLCPTCRVDEDLDLTELLEHDRG